MSLAKLNVVISFSTTTTTLSLSLYPSSTSSALEGVNSIGEEDWGTFLRSTTVCESVPGEYVEVVEVVDNF